jgi:hypothetical protein
MGPRVGRSLTHALGFLLAAAVLLQLLDLRMTDGDLSLAVPGALAYSAVVATGWLLAVRVPGNSIGWTLLLVAAVFSAGGVTLVLGDAFRGSDPGFAAWMYWISGDQDNTWTWVPAMLALLVWLPLHFPDGRLPSTRWRWLSWLAVLLLAYASAVFAMIMGDPWGLPNPTAIPAVQRDGGPLVATAAALAIICFGGAVASLVVRYRRGDGTLRAQLRWVLWAVALATTALAVSWLLPPGLTWWDHWILALFALIPIAIGVAVLRYRLYDIDRIISRTAAYAAVTLVVVGTYALVVVASSLALPRLPSVGVALATLAAAAVFLPALRGIRRAVDRVFDRARYDAERVVETFGERMRTAEDPQSASEDLTQAIEQTLQPASIGVWTTP